jgi:DNA-binding MarR family transcriptional regulator
MDAATIKGVVDRLRHKGLVATLADPADRRRLVLAPTEAGVAAYAEACPAAHRISAETLAPLSPAERDTFVKLLTRLG